MVTGEIFHPRSKLAGYSTEVKEEHSEQFVMNLINKYAYKK